MKQKRQFKNCSYYITHDYFPIFGCLEYQIQERSQQRSKYILIHIYQLFFKDKKNTSQMQNYKTKSTLNPPITKPQILQTFHQYGYEQFSMITKQKMNSIFQEQYQQKKHRPINTQLLQQIWDQSEATTKGQISVNTITDIILEAQNILASRVDRLTGPNGIICGLQEKIKEKELEVKEFAQFHGEDRDYLNSVTKDFINMQIQNKQNKTDLQAFTDDYQAINCIFEQQKPKDFTKYTLPTPVQATKFQKSSRLLTAFHIVNILLLLQFIFMNSLRLSFLPLSSILHCYSVLLLGFTQPSQLLYLILHILFAVLGDLTFVVLTLMNKYEIMPIKHTDNNTYVFILGILFFAAIVLRIFKIIIFVAFRSSYQHNVKRYFSIMGQKFPPHQPQQALPSYGYYSQYSYNQQQQNYQTKLPGDRSKAQVYQKQTQRQRQRQRYQQNQKQRSRINQDISHVQTYKINTRPNTDSPIYEYEQHQNYLKDQMPMH